MTDNVVQQALSGEGYDDFQSRWVLVVAWHNVSRYSSDWAVQILQYFNVMYL